MHNAPSRTPQQAGFTLVELSIVLVIIGLIVGGVLVGQDMIRAAEIRSTISQIERYNSAVNTFRDKYGNLPGDVLGSDATRFGFTARAGTANQGDGDRLVEAQGSGLLYGNETGLFWRDMSQVALVDNGFVTADDTLGGAAAVAVAVGQMSDYLPEAKIGLGHYITVHSNAGRNFFQISRVTAIDAAGVYTLENAMTPQTAFNIDDKIDDGAPLNGSAVAAYSTTALNAAIVEGSPGATTAFTFAGAAATDCASDAVTAGASIYNTATEQGANQPACQLRIRASF
jgi:prepilin-type N-terminal cleavage/methylation domain-containing protein